MVMEDNPKMSGLSPSSLSSSSSSSSLSSSSSSPYDGPRPRWDRLHQDFVNNVGCEHDLRVHDYEGAWIWVLSKSLETEFVELSHRFDAATAAAATATATAAAGAVSSTVPAPANQTDALPDGGNAKQALLRAALAMKCHPPLDDSEDSGSSYLTPTPRRALVDAMDGVYGSEEAFSQRLFHAVVKCFTESGWDVHTVLRAPEPLPSPVFEDSYMEDEEDKERVHDAMIVLGRRHECAYPSYTLRTYVVRVGTHEYAMGLCRTMESNEYERACTKGGFFPDHSWAIFRKPEDGEDWRVHHVLASVELTLSNMACPAYKYGHCSYHRAVGVDNFKFPYLRHGWELCYRDDELYGPLGEALRDTMDKVRRGRASLGLGVPIEIPFAVVTARRQGAKPRKEPTCWTHGYVRTPQECGGIYDFVLDAFGMFHDRSGQEAAAAYLDVLADGFGAAETWLGSIAERAELFMASPLTGRTLKFGDQVLEGVQFVASPLTRRCRHSAPASERRLKITQGELYRGNVDLSRLREATTDCENVVWFFGESTKPGITPVLVKVSSTSTYGQLIERGLLQTRCDSLNTKYMYHNPQLLAALVQSIGPSLFGIYALEKGLVQIMPDLTKLGFHPLRPKAFLTDPSEAKKMWSAFRQFVEHALLPLAVVGVIHPDLRPGYDASSNLLYNNVAGEIRVVDLDTLMHIADEFRSHDKRIIVRARLYPGNRSFRTAVEVLFAQVVVITESWRREVNDSDAVAEDLFTGSEWGKAWLKDASINCDAAFVRATLDQIGRRFLKIDVLVSATAVTRSNGRGTGWSIDN